MVLQKKKILPQSVSGVPNIQSDCYKANGLRMGTRWRVKASLQSHIISEFLHNGELCTECLLTCAGTAGPCEHNNE